jgi:hypothetical protein
MKIRKWAVAIALSVFLSGGVTFAQGHGHGKGNDKHGDDDQGDYYKDRDREQVREWYNEHQEGLPPGLAKKDRLPPGLEKQLVRRGTLPPGLQKRIQPCPEDLDCAHVVIGGHIVLLNRNTNLVVDIFYFEIR